MKPSFDDTVAWLAAKPDGHFTVERWGNGWAITVHRVGCPTETILCQSPAQVNRQRLQLSDDGLVGFIAGGAQ